MAEDVVMDKNAFFKLFEKGKEKSLPPKLKFQDYYGKCNGAVMDEGDKGIFHLAVINYGRILEAK
jgi:hypothetical protein